MLNLLTLRRIVALMSQRRVPFQEDVGAFCPLCQEFFSECIVGDVTRTMLPEASVRIRYHYCRNCACTFSSVEEIDAALVKPKRQAPEPIGRKIAKQPRGGRGKR